MNFKQNFDKFQEQINKKYKKYTWNKQQKNNNCEIEHKTLTNTQKFVRDYLNPDNPNGLFLFHSVGSGKTLSGVNILSKFEKLGYNTLWVTRTTLKKDIQKALDIIHLDKPLVVLSYKQFSNVAKGKGKIYSYLISKTKSSNPIDNTIVIIDEAHKLYTKDLKAQEYHDISAIEKIINNSKNSKIVLMTATPIVEDPIEFIKLLNLIITNKEDRFDTVNFKKNYLDNSGNLINKKNFKEKIKGLISYIDLSNDNTRFAKPNKQEILVPLSSFENTTQNCNSIYKLCRNFNVNSKLCKIKKDICERKNKIIKKEYKEGDYQNKILNERCSLNLDKRDT